MSRNKLWFSTSAEHELVAPDLFVYITGLSFAGNEAMVRCLLEEGADAGAVDGRGMTPIAHASQSGNLPAARVLLKVKAPGSGSSGYASL